MIVPVNLIFVLFTTLILQIAAYRILGVFPFRSKSHDLMYHPIAKELAKRGHQMDVITFFPSKEPIPNYKVVANLGKVEESFQNRWDFEYMSDVSEDVFSFFKTIFGNDVCQYLAMPEVQEIIHQPPTDPPYDLLLMESFGFNCFLGLGYKLNVTVVLVTSLADSPWLDASLGQPFDTTAYFGAFAGFDSHPMTFFERVYNTVLNYLNLFRVRRYTEVVQNALIKKYIDPNIPSLRELEKNVALALVNSYHSLHGVRPLVPNLIEVGGLHVYEHYEEMSFELEKWMNESTAGVVYFTLGSMVNIETLPENVLRAFYSVFTRITPVRVLMKAAHKEKLLPGLPKNVKVLSWIPQTAVLVHPNTKVFITHGGLMSTQEALTFGVPMIGIPLFADQFSNIDYFVKKNMAEELNLKMLTEDSIYDALNKVLSNPMYRKSAKYESARFIDRPLSPMNTSIFWIEYAIRHGPKALRSPVVDMPWWQSALIDVYLFLFLSTLLVAFLIVTTLKQIFILFSALIKKGQKLHNE